MPESARRLLCHHFIHTRPLFLLPSFKSSRSLSHSLSLSLLSLSVLSILLISLSFPPSSPPSLSCRIKIKPMHKHGPPEAACWSASCLSYAMIQSWVCGGTGTVSCLRPPLCFYTVLNPDTEEPLYFLSTSSTGLITGKFHVILVFFLFYVILFTSYFCTSLF